MVILGKIDAVGDVACDGGDGSEGGDDVGDGGGGGPSAELSKDVCLVQKENDAGIQEHFAVCHHIEQLNILILR